jgi:hypothetical protein
MFKSTYILSIISGINGMKKNVYAIPSKKNAIIVSQ